MNCPMCGKPNIKTKHGLAQHLAGGAGSGGHDLTASDAAEVAEAGWTGVVTSAGKPATNVGELLHILHGVPEDSAAEFLRLLLLNLVNDKRLPKYQFERRIDCFLTPFLPEIVTKVIGKGGQARLVAPEFPIKKKTDTDGNVSNQSTNADHLMILRDRPDEPDAWLLVELKTDSGSYNAEQAEIYRNAVLDGWPRLRADLETIRNASKKKDGYTELIKRVDTVAEDSPPDRVEVLYLTPGYLPTEPFHSIHFSQLVHLELSGHSTVWAILKELVLPALN